MKSHLANHCIFCPEEISTYWRKKLVEEVNKYTRKLAPASMDISMPLQNMQNDPLLYETNHFAKLTKSTLNYKAHAETETIYINTTSNVTYNKYCNLQYLLQPTWVL
ncbi:24179_t:CDS:2 [Dentiscutata erythropus]|uniref:24179_t:CDS:1 n=1 Tax=Dentiscutata erythropus TaxID=1348616 RepID=A0A9N8Z4C3_9GLOM|nr:24179_t:CDS:2 [Dentiscutata erythropus]